MKPAMFAEMNLVLGAPDEWDAAKHGECSGLPVEVNREACTLTSCWQLEPGDIETLAAGGRVYLTIFGLSHPVVAMAVRAKE